MIVPHIEFLGVALDLGQVTVLIGPNASGKTTLLDAVERAALAGADVRRLSSRKLDLDEERARHPSGLSDGELQILLIRETLLGGTGSALVLLDDPEASLDLAALVAVADVVKQACGQGRQVVMATHSPVLMSQFDAADVVLVEHDRLTRVTAIASVLDLLETYALGSLYMAGLLTTAREPRQSST